MKKHNKKKGNSWRIQCLGKINNEMKWIYNIFSYICKMLVKKKWWIFENIMWVNITSIMPVLEMTLKIWTCNKILGISNYLMSLSLYQHEKTIWCSLKFKSDSANEITLTWIFSSIIVVCSFFYSGQTSIHLGTAVIAKICSFHFEICPRYLVGCLE